MQEEGGANAQPRRWEEREPAVQEEDQVEEEEGQAQLNQDLGRNISQEFTEQSLLECI